MGADYVRIHTDFVQWGSVEISALLGVPRHTALGHMIHLCWWAAARGWSESPVRIVGPHAAAVLAAGAAWEGDPGPLVMALTDPAVGFATADADGISVSLDRVSPNFRRLDPTGVVLDEPRVRLKTPAERAEAERQYAQAAEANRIRAVAERQRRDVERAARRASARVYFIQQDGGERLVKIGTTCRPVEVRLRELQAGQPHPLVILAHAPGGRYEEGRLHDRFGPHCVTGEWFRPAADLLSYVAAVGKAGVL